MHKTHPLEVPSTPEEISDYVQDPAVQQLIHYYEHDVARVMPWLDGPDNDWRNLLLPLAMKSPSLLMATLALAAEHYASKTGSNWTGAGGRNSSYFRDQSLLLLADNLRAEMSRNSFDQREDPASAILATILILCNLEMARPASALWTVHWKAARTITRRLTSPIQPAPDLDSTARFLIKEAWVVDVFASSTTFDSNDDICSSVLREEDDGIFTDWMKLIQEVTRCERCSFPNIKGDGTGTRLRDLNVLHDRFDFARRRTLQFSKALDLESTELETDFRLLVDIFHYAGLLYSFQALYHRDQFVLAKQELAHNTMIAINRIESSDAFLHDFVWPLFILGTESRDDTRLQEYVESRMLQATNSTAFSNCYPVLQFLQNFWMTEPAVAADWMGFARQESARGFTFLVL
jgi:hypothetical protein